jgi:hypothetical protein
MYTWNKILLDGPCKHGNEAADSIKGRELLDHLSDYLLHKYKYLFTRAFWMYNLWKNVL